MKESQKKWISKIPQSYQANYRTAMSGKSRASAIKAKCLDCMCWQRVEVANCTNDACPLHPYRPYQSKSGARTPRKSRTLENKTDRGVL